jgi:hypothetical protein
MAMTPGNVNGMSNDQMMAEMKKISEEGNRNTVETAKLAAKSTLVAAASKFFTKAADNVKGLTN